MSQPTLPDRNFSLFSIIDLDFKVPFNAQGPPEFLEKAFTRCLEELKREAHCQWIMWGSEAEARNSVYIMIGWKQPSNQRDTVAQAAMSELKNKGLPESIEVLSLFLASSPSIYHAQGPDIHEPIPYELYLFYERSCNIFIVQAPKPSALYDSIKNELVSLRQHCQLQLPTNICGVSQPWGDMRDVILGDDDLGDVFCPGSESNVCTFIFLVYWGSLDAMERFKNPKQESFQRYGGRIASDWWTKEVVARFLTLHDAGACIKQGTFRMRDFEANAPLTWPHVKNWQEQAMVRRRTRVRERGCTSCCTM